MKKAVIIILGLVFLGFISFSLTAAQSQGEKGCAKTCPVKTCPMQQKAAEEAAKVQGNPEGAEHNCDYKGKCEHLTLRLKGVADKDAEVKITKALMDKKGVVKIHTVSSESGTAVFCYDPEIVKAEDLAKFMTEAGFEATVEPGSITNCQSKK